ncbi:MAG: hypothetical protein RIC55_26840 [Pirellulaceae bacterium]
MDWDIIAGIAAAVLAIVLHLLHVVEVDVIFTVVLVLLAMLLFRDLRRESHDERLSEAVGQAKNTLEEIQLSIRPPDAILVGPRHLRAESRRFSEMARGEMVWFNVCFLMFKTQDVFDLMLRPAIENPLVTSIQFVSNENEKSLWEQHMLPKIKECDGGQKVREPRWTALPETVSFILADVEQDGKTEALLSFWGEPFMARTTAQQVPRYIFRVQSHSDLVPRLVELERQHRMGG